MKNHKTKLTAPEYIKHLEENRAEYNGWTNWETWSALTWLTNDQTSQDRLNACKSAIEIKGLYRYICQSDENFGDHREYNKVNWDEIFKHQEEHKEENTNQATCHFG